MTRQPPAPVIETPRLALRRLSTDDADFILELLNEPSFLRYIGDKGVRTREDAGRYILAGPMASYERFGFGLYRVERKDGGEPIGICGLLKRDSLEDVDVGFAFLPRFWSRRVRVRVRRRRAGARAADLGAEADPGHHLPGQRGLDPSAGESSAFGSSGWRDCPKTRRRSGCSRRRPDYSVSSFFTRRVSSAASSIDTPPSSRAFVASLPR